MEEKGQTDLDNFIDSCHSKYSLIVLFCFVFKKSLCIPENVDKDGFCLLDGTAARAPESLLECAFEINAGYARPLFSAGWEALPGSLCPGL